MHSLAALAGTDAVGLVNPRSITFKRLKLDPASLSPEQAAELISQHPTLMIRPVLSDGKQATLGYNQEAMSKLL